MSAERLPSMAPDFTLNDIQGRAVRLSAYQGDKHILLVFSRGFT